MKVAVIGAGTAGLTAYNAAAKLTDSVILIEEGPGGTTCARVGCMPSKLLIAAANRARDVRDAGTFGIEAGDCSIDGGAVMTRVRALRDSFVNEVLKSMAKIPAARKLRGRARFISPGRLAVDGEAEVQAERIVIATGASPHVPASLFVAGDRLLVNDDLFELETLPAAVAVFGAGFIGVELGQALARLGVRVAMFGRSGSLAGIEDPEIREYAARHFADEFYLDTAAGDPGVEQRDGGLVITYNHRDRGRVSESFDYLLAATGRRPNLDTLQLENSGLALDDDGVPTFDHHTMQCGDHPVFFAGDANRHLPLLHEAADEGRTAGTNAVRYPDIDPGGRRVSMRIVFTEPQIMAVGSVGGENCECGRASFENQGRSRVIGADQGLLKVYGERGSGRFLGAEMFGPAAEHIAHLLAWAAQQRLTVSDMLGLPYYHPVIEEGVRTALADLNYRLKQGAEPGDRCMTCGPGG